MIRTLFTIKLTPAEARLARKAIEAYGGKFPIDRGPSVLERGDWHDLSKWLGWQATDMELRLELETRKACERLSARIDFALRGEGVEVVEAEKVPAGLLF